jgi:hypothetical protein
VECLAFSTCIPDVLVSEFSPESGYIDRGSSLPDKSSDCSYHFENKTKNISGRTQSVAHLIKFTLYALTMRSPVYHPQTNEEKSILNLPTMHGEKNKIYMNKYTIATYRKLLDSAMNFVQQV